MYLLQECISFKSLEDITRTNFCSFDFLCWFSLQNKGMNKNHSIYPDKVFGYSLKVCILSIHCIIHIDRSAFLKIYIDIFLNHK